MGKLTDDLVAAAAQGKADAELVSAAFMKLGGTITRLTEALANQPDDAALQAVLTDMNAEHAALGAALAGIPADTPTPTPVPAPEPAPAAAADPNLPGALDSESPTSFGTGEAGS